MDKTFNADIFLQQEVSLAAEGKPIDVPVDGAIGLLALGDLGTIAWRKKILEVKMELARRTNSNLSNQNN